MVEIPEAFDLGMKGGKFDDIDLELRLSTGGRLYKEEAKEPRKDQEPKNPDLEYEDNVQSCSRSSLSLEFVSDMETNSLVVDKRAMQALRRKEAKKKMDEKNRKKRMMMMMRESKGSTKERDSEEESDERLNKKQNVGEGIEFNKGGMGLGGFPPSAFSPHVVAQMPYPCQWIPNGYGYAVPFWCLGVESNGVVAVGGFNKHDVEQNKAGCGEGQGVDRKAGSGESTLCSLDAGSGNLVSPQQDDASAFEMSLTNTNLSKPAGGSNGDTASHSTLSQIERRHLNSSTASSAIRTLNRDTVDNVEGTEEITASTNSSRIGPTSIVQELGNSEAENRPDNSSTDTSNLNPGSTKGTAGEEHHKPQIFRVSTTGNGPNGRTIIGMLGRYTKTEVTITCTCHGSSFSPAEFVEHAGGTDVTHPLRHIVMLP